MATHSGIHTWKIPWREEPGGLQSMGSHKNRSQLSDQVTTASTSVLKGSDSAIKGVKIDLRQGGGEKKGTFQ